MLGLVFAAGLVTYLDRVCLSAAAPLIREELGLSQQQLGWVFSVFNLAYAIFEVPTGWLGDLWGQKRMMLRIVGCWSAFTILTGMVRGYASLVAVRFVFGAAEAGAFPTLSRALARWFPVHERSRANGLMWTGARLGGALAPPLAVAVIAWLGWRGMFSVFGIAGIAWCMVWAAWYRDPGGSVEEPASGTPWKKLATDRNMVALFWTYFASGFGFQFFVTWLPTYLMTEHGLTLERSGMYAALPLAAGAAGCLAGGAIADRLTRATGSVAKGRRMVGVTGFLVSAACFGAAIFAGSAEAAVAGLVLAAGTHDVTLPVAWATCTDTGGRYGGTAAGFMNLASSISGFVAPIAAAWLADAFGSFHAVFVVAAAVYVAGGLLWFVIDAGRPAIA